MNETLLMDKDYELALKRLEKTSSPIAIAMLGKIFTTKDLIQNIKKRTPEGDKWVLMQMEYMNYLVTR